MTTQVLRYSLIRYQPNMLRREVVNVGAVLFAEGGPLVSVLPTQGKVSALDPNFPIARLFDQVDRLREALNAEWERHQDPERVASEYATRGSITVGPLGWIETGERPLELILDEILQELVAPPAKRRQRSPITSRLNTELRRMFDAAKMLGSSPDDINKHLVVPRYPIDAATGLFAEFALQNGKLHVTETVDFRTSTPAIRRLEAQAKTLVLHEAMNRLGKKKLKRYVVVTGATQEAQASVNLLSKYADDLIVRESNSDWLRYVDAMHAAAKGDSAEGLSAS